MNIKNRIKIFASLGEKLTSYLKNGFPAEFTEVITKSSQYNTWFTEDNIKFSLNAISKLLTSENLVKWVSSYEFKNNEQKKVAVVMAGNIPLVGFHDFLSVLISGNIFIGKLSSQDKFLLPAIADELIKLEPSFKNFISFTEERLSDFDTVIATGSDNSSRYFEYYFEKYPHIIRSNRNSIAILTGNESVEDLELLSDDIFMYFGLGCRNVTKIFIPENYDLPSFIEILSKSSNKLAFHNKYLNNYEYNKSIFLINQVKHLDSGFCLLKEDASIPSPIAVLHYEYYKNIDDVLKIISKNRDKIQCLVSKTIYTDYTVPFGKSQQPELWDYSDGVDTLKFLCSF